jgi:hypothetical protein
MNDTVKVLEHAKGLLRKGWTKGVYARNAAGTRVEVCSKAAVSFCMTGAVMRAGYDLGGGTIQAELALRRTPQIAVERFGSFAQLNDHADSVEDVIAVFDAAIAAESGK